MTQMATAGEAIVETLQRCGVRTVFGIPGVHTYHLFDALYARRADIRFIGTRHEQCAAYMAYGYARTTGKPGVYTCVPGPGVLNTAAALCTAYAGNAPVLCLTSEIPTGEIGRGHGILHELPNQLATLKSLTKSAERISHPAHAPAAVARALQSALSGRPGPVALECPWDTLGQSAPVSYPAPFELTAAPQPHPGSIEKAAQLIAAARNPLIMVGSGAVDAGAEVLQLARRLQAPVTSHRSGRGIVSDDSPYSLNHAAAFHYWGQTDLLIAVGTRMDLQFSRWRRLPPGLKIIRIDIDPEEIPKRAIDVGIVTDAALGVRALLDTLPASPARPSRESEFQRLKEKSRLEIQSVQPQLAYLDAIRAVLPRDGFLVEEICQVGFTARFGFPVYEPRTYVAGGYQENLGFGFMTALGVKVAHPNRAVVSISGDGGFLYGATELATAAQNGINVVTVVFNNRSFGNVLRDQRTTFGGRVIGADLANPDFLKLGESFGVLSVRAENPAELRAALERGLAADAPVLIEVPGEPGAEGSPWPFIMPA